MNGVFYSVKLYTASFLCNIRHIPETCYKDEINTVSEKVSKINAIEEANRSANDKEKLIHNCRLKGQCIKIIPNRHCD